MKAFAAALLCMLGGCAGTAHYTVEPFYEPTTQKMICCRAEAFSGKDVSAVSFDLAMQPGGSITVHFTETGVGATAPLTAQGAVISNVATAAGNTAAAIIKLAP
jgi:hypothetical protein